MFVLYINKIYLLSPLYLKITKQRKKIQKQIFKKSIQKLIKNNYHKCLKNIMFISYLLD